MNEEPVALPAYAIRRLIIAVVFGLVVGGLSASLFYTTQLQDLRTEVKILSHDYAELLARQEAQENGTP